MQACELVALWMHTYGPPRIATPAQAPPPHTLLAAAFPLLPPNPPTPPRRQAPDVSAGSYAREEAAALDLLQRASDLPLEPVPPTLDLPQPPAPDCSTLPDPRVFTTVEVKLKGGEVRFGGPSPGVAT